jgi:hypothetical protein
MELLNVRAIQKFGSMKEVDELIRAARGMFRIQFTTPAGAPCEFDATIFEHALFVALNSVKMNHFVGSAPAASPAQEAVAAEREAAPPTALSRLADENPYASFFSTKTASANAVAARYAGVNNGQEDNQLTYRNKMTISHPTFIPHDRDAAVQLCASLRSQSKLAGLGWSPIPVTTEDGTPIPHGIDLSRPLPEDLNTKSYGDLARACAIQRNDIVSVLLKFKFSITPMGVKSNIARARMDTPYKVLYNYDVDNNICTKIHPLTPGTTRATPLGGAAAAAQLTGGDPYDARGLLPAA